MLMGHISIIAPPPRRYSPVADGNHHAVAVLEQFSC